MLERALDDVERQLQESNEVFDTAMEECTVGDNESSTTPTAPPACQHSEPTSVQCDKASRIMKYRKLLDSHKLGRIFIDNFAKPVALFAEQVLSLPDRLEHDCSGADDCPLKQQLTELHKRIRPIIDANCIEGQDAPEEKAWMGPLMKKKS